MDGLMIVLLVCAAGGILAFAAVSALSPEPSLRQGWP